MILALSVAFLSNRLNKALSNRRVSTILESVHVNMSLLISEILPRGLVFFSSRKIRAVKKKMISHLNNRAAIAEGIDSI